jgi:hypothetical protein
LLRSPERDRELLLKLANVGVELVRAAEAWGAIVDPLHNEQAEQRRNKEQDRFGHDTFYSLYTTL